MVVFNLVLVRVLFIVVEAVGSRSRRAGQARFSEAVGIGLAPAAALVPGVSRPERLSPRALSRSEREERRGSLPDERPHYRRAPVLCSSLEVVSEGIDA